MALLRRKSSGSSSSSSSPFLSSGKIVSDVPPAPRPPLRRLSKRSSVGPGTVSHCLDNLLAKIDCEILQPTPDFTHLNEQVRGKVATSGQGKGSGCMSDMSENCTLLPSGRRTLCLWFDPQEKEYHLTAIKLDKDEVSLVFLNCARFFSGPQFLCVYLLVFFLGSLCESICLFPCLCLSLSL